MKSRDGAADSGGLEADEVVQEVTGRVERRAVVDTVQGRVRLCAGTGTSYQVQVRSANSWSGRWNRSCRLH
jgi:hypothetical protein